MSRTRSALVSTLLVLTGAFAVVLFLFRSLGPTEPETSMEREWDSRLEAEPSPADEAADSSGSQPPFAEGASSIADPPVHSPDGRTLVVEARGWKSGTFFSSGKATEVIRDRVDLSGFVEPVCAGATVVLRNTDGDVVARALTDLSGRFTLKSIGVGVAFEPRSNIGHPLRYSLVVTHPGGGHAAFGNVDPARGLEREIVLRRGRLVRLRLLDPAGDPLSDLTVALKCEFGIPGVPDHVAEALSDAGGGVSFEDVPVAPSVTIWMRRPAGGSKFLVCRTDKRGTEALADRDLRFTVDWRE